MKKQRRQHGWVMIELLTTLSVLVILTGGMAAVLNGAGRVNRILWARQQARVAIEAHLDSLTHTAKPLPPEEFERLWPNFKCAVEYVSGDGPTERLRLATVTLTARVDSKTICLTGKRYLPEQEH